MGFSVRRKTLISEMQVLAHSLSVTEVKITNVVQSTVLYECSTKHDNLNSTVTLSKKTGVKKTSSGLFDFKNVDTCRRFEKNYRARFICSRAARCKNGLYTKFRIRI